MALEEEFSIEIPDEKADKLTCCADVAKYIASEADQKILEKPWLLGCYCYSWLWHPYGIYAKLAWLQIWMLVDLQVALLLLLVECADS